MDKQAEQPEPFEQLEAELKQMKPAAADTEWEQGVRAQFVDEPPKRSLLFRWAVPLSAAACVGLLLIVFWPTQPASIDDGVIVLASGWRIEPTGDATFTVQSDDRVKLERGELFISSNAQTRQLTAVPKLTIETPEGDAHAAGTQFFIGFHEDSKKGQTMQRLTRVLVLAGVVTLTNPLGSVTGNANDLLAAESKQPPSKLTVQANSDFAIDLYKQLAKAKAGANLFFSPYSISSALAMTAEGARGQTAVEMGKVLRYPNAAKRVGDDAQLIPWQSSLIHSGFQQINRQLQSDPNDPKVAAMREKIAVLRKELADAKAKTKAERDYRKRSKLIAAEQKIAAELNKLASQVDQFELNVANALWGEKTYRIEQPYRDAIAKFYDSGAIEPADFRGNFEGERVRINSWVEDQTKNRIKNLIPKGGLDALTRLVLVNAIYFKGEWETPFKERMTKPIDFTLSDGKTIKAKTMHAYGLNGARYGAFNGDGTFFKTPHRISGGEKVATYPGDDGFMVATLPYKGKELSMVLVTPITPEKFDAVEKQLSSANLTQWLDKLEKRKVSVVLPKFKMETDYALHETLSKMGMVRAFTDPRKPNGADFTGMHDTSNLMDRLYITAVLHKAFVEVNEKGTEAAAATAVIMAVPTSAPLVRDFTPTFSADRPFITIIRHNETGAILFMGRVTDPTQVN